MKIQFDVKFRPQIESGEYKVETREGSSVRIICWDADAVQPIVGLVCDSREKRESVGMFSDNGRYYAFTKEDSRFDLFIVTPETELTEFEKCLIEYADKRDEFEYDSEKVCELNQEVITLTHNYAKALCELAKKELCKDCAANMEGYIKGRQDAIKEVEENRPYKYEGPSIPAFWPPCYYGGPCTNPQYDCINCPRRAITVRFNTITGTSSAKEEGKE